MTSLQTPQPVGWLAAQKRPIIAVTVAALALLATAFFVGDRPLILSRLLWPGLLYYLAFVLSALAPLWLVQAAIYLQMRRHGRPLFVHPGAVASLPPERTCPFLLALRPRVFTLSALYLASTPSAATRRQWVRPAWLFFALFATGLLAFCLWTTFVPALPPLLLLSAMTFWFSAFILGLSDLFGAV
ncbi:MAG: hypothetical protein R3272_08930 [Candidatus Promineifilaceae bacterium]|nr:hypothetical protein [Candidatus Promineifilaceae bacterium]